MPQPSYVPSRIDEALKAAGLPVIGVGQHALGSDRTPWPDATWHTRFDYLIRLDWSQQPTQQQINNADVIVQAANPTLPTLQEQAVMAFNDPQVPNRVVDRAIVLSILDEYNPVGIVTQTWNPAAIVNGAGLSSPAVAVNGGLAENTAAFGDVVDVAAPYDLQGLLATAYVSAPGFVVVRISNLTGGSVNLASGDWFVAVRRPRFRTPTQAKAAVTSKIESGGAN